MRMEQRRRCFRPLLEALEDRAMLAASVFLSAPTNLSGNQGTIVRVPISVNQLSDASGDQGLKSFSLSVTYDPAVFTFWNVGPGPVDPQGHNDIDVSHPGEVGYGG